MGMNAALPDRGRVIRQQIGARTYGEPQLVPDKGPWFRCRVEDVGSVRTNSSKGPGDSSENARSRFVRQPSIMIAKRDLDYSPVDIRPTDTLEINSREFGRFLCRFEGDPRIIRRRRRFNHFEGTIAIVSEQ